VGLKRAYELLGKIPFIAWLRNRPPWFKELLHLLFIGYLFLYLGFVLGGQVTCAKVSGDFVWVSEFSWDCVGKAPDPVIFNDFCVFDANNTLRCDIK
jgi:hypothetical protein